MATCVPFEADTSCCNEWASLDETVQERSLELAWDSLRALSGGRVGNCPATMRPCLGPPCDICANHGQWVRPFIRDGDWYNIACGRDPCLCARLCEILFPGPVAALDIHVDGELLPADAYRIDNGYRLVRTDGACWPSCQSGSFVITYIPGVIPDGAGLWAAGVLACEFSKACSGAKCRLPQGITAVVRQGVSFVMSAEMFPDGMTGIREVDAYLTSINPHHHQVPPMVWSPDVPWAKHRYETPTIQVTP